MRFLIMGDAHLRDTTPRNRTDDFHKTQKEKVVEIIKIAFDKGAFILQPGDLFHSSRAPYSLLNTYLELLLEEVPPICTVYGQHDLRYHVDRENTPTYTMLLFKKIFLADSSEPLCFKGFNIYGAGWGEQIPEITTVGFNILLMHRMVIHDEKLWGEQKEYVLSKHLLREYKFDLIVTGDNHQFFMDNYKERYLFNMGSVMRSGIDQIDHIPSVCLFDSRTRQYQLIPLNIQPAGQVFKMEQVTREKERDENLTAFVSELSEHKDLGLHFEDNLSAYLFANKIEKDVQDIINDCIRRG